MSNKIVNLVDKARVGDPVAKAVLRKIADQSNDFGGGVWSSHEHISYCLEWSRQTVSAKCQWLQDEGWLTWETRPGTSNLYTVNVEKLLEGVKETDTPDEQVSSTLTPPVKEVDTTCKPDGHKSLSSPKLTNNIVITPDGTPVDEHLVCEHCKSAPKMNKRKGTKYCLECKNLGNCARCGEHKVEQYPKKRKELCFECGELVDGMFKSYAYLTFQKRSNHRLDWQQVEAIVKTVGEDRNMLFAWGKWLDYWKASGWFMGKNAIGKLLKGFEDNLDEYLTDKSPAGTITKPKGNYDPNARINLKQRPDESDEDYQKRIGG